MEIASVPHSGRKAPTLGPLKVLRYICIPAGGGVCVPVFVGVLCEGWRDVAGLWHAQTKWPRLSLAPRRKRVSDLKGGANGVGIKYFLHPVAGPTAEASDGLQEVCP